MEPSQESILLHAMLISNILHNKGFDDRTERSLAFSIAIIVLKSLWNYQETPLLFVPEEYLEDCQHILSIIRRKGNGIIQLALKEVEKGYESRKQENHGTEEQKSKISFTDFVNVLDKVPDSWMDIVLNADCEECLPLKKHNSFANNLTEKLEDIKFMEEEEEYYQRRHEEEEEEEDNQLSSPSRLLRRFSVDL